VVTLRERGIDPVGSSVDLQSPERVEFDDEEGEAGGKRSVPFQFEGSSEPCEKVVNIYCPAARMWCRGQEWEREMNQPLTSFNATRSSTLFEDLLSFTQDAKRRVRRSKVSGELGGLTIPDLSSQNILKKAGTGLAMNEAGRERTEGTKG
jgi:hypothetical protein